MVIHSCLTIIFDGSFYQGIFEVHDHGQYSVAKVTLGSSAPTIPMILRIVNQRYGQLHFHRINENGRKLIKHVNPKRAQREAQKALNKRLISTKAQTVLQDQLELHKKASKKKRAHERKQIKNDRFKKKQKKRREKHRGH